MLQSTNRTGILFFTFILVSTITFAQSDVCTSPTSLTPATSCSNISGTLYLANNEGTKTSLCGTTYDVWYSFATPINCTAMNIDVASLPAGGSNIDNTNTFIEAFSGASCSPALLGSCTPIGTTLSLSGLAPSTTYYVRVFTITNPTSGNASKWDYTICLTYTPPPANDNCSGAITLTSGTTNSSGTVWNASASSGISAGCATGNPDDDVWYSFIPAANSLTVTLPATGSNLTTSGPRMQIFSGTCGSLTSVACGSTSITTAVTTGAAYYIRVYSAGTGSIGGTSSGSTFSILASSVAPVTVSAGRMNEVFQQTILSPSSILNYPWEVTYGPDNNLWITESKGYKVYKMDPVTGTKTTILDISQGSTFFTAPADVAFNCQFSNGSGAQGGLAGLALHPQFLAATSPQNYVYISYIYSSNGGSAPTGIFFTNRLVRFTYNTSTGKLESPVSLCDTLPGSSDHNSQRMIIAPDVSGGTNYLFYGSGDMGSGQFGNRDRAQKAQNPASYEGKILRFNLAPDADAGLAAWIPNDNPYSATSAVWSIGIRNNQGFAYDTASHILYGSSHGPYSDDEINVIEGFKNYGHPLVIGYAADGNYNGTTTASTNTSISAGAPFTDNSGNSTCAPIGNELTNKTAIDASGNGLYKDPLFAAYAAPNATIANIWRNNTGNSSWPSEGWSGLDLYTHTLIPGWKKSLVAGGLKWGRLIKLKLGSAGNTILPTGGQDTVTYFQSTNRYRDLAFAPNGKDVFIVMDNNSATSGPGTGNPIVPACPGCVIKYTFLGYADAGGKSSIPTSIDVTDGIVNTCGNAGTTVVIDNTNNNIWVPITGPDGNIMAEIYANGYNLDTVRSSFYKNSGPIRIKNSIRYLDRNMTITPKNQPGASGVKIRLYFSKAEFDALDIDPLSGISSISDLKILKNTDNCGAAVSATTTLINPVFSEAHGSNGYMLQANISGFSSFYFANSSITLPLDLITFKANLLTNNTALLQWQTANEINTSYFTVERSIDANNFTSIGEVTAYGSNNTTTRYSYTDNTIANILSPVIYYRLKITDINGTFKYSGIVSVTLADITGKVTIAPNPVVSNMKVTISAPEDGKVQWKLIDNAGRVIMQSSMQVIKGNGNNISISMDKLATGSYYLSVSGAGIEQKIKLQKL